MSNEQHTNGVAEAATSTAIIPGQLTELDLHKHELSYFKGVSPSDPMNKMWAFSLSIKDAAFVPPAARGSSGTVFFMIARGQEIGIPWTQAVTSLYPMSKKMEDGSVHTRLGMEGHVALALLLSKGFKCKVIHSDSKCAEWWMSRPDGSLEFQDSFTIEEAVELGLTRKPNWKYPKDMLRWRAFMRVGRIVGADVLGGLHLPDELSDDIVMQPDETGTYSQEAAKTAADKKAEEDPGLRIVPKAKSAPVVEAVAEEIKPAQTDEPKQDTQPEEAQANQVDDDDVPAATADPPVETEEQKAERGLREHMLEVCEKHQGVELAHLSRFVGNYTGPMKNVAHVERCKQWSHALSVLEEDLHQHPSEVPQLIESPVKYAKFVRDRDFDK